MDKAIIGQRIRQQREKLFLTREQFAEQIEISPRFLADIESGGKGMSAETLYKICRRVDTSADYILLGRQSTEGIQTPIAEILSSIPPQYSAMVENILRAFSQAVKIAGGKGG